MRTVGARLDSLERRLAPSSGSVLKRLYIGWPPEGARYAPCQEHENCLMKDCGAIEVHCIPGMSNIGDLS